MRERAGEHKARYKVSPQGPTFVLTVRYPDGRTRLYEGDEIPSRVTVPPGSTVRLEFSLRSGESGTHAPKACAESLTDLPEEGERIIGVAATASGSVNTGEFHSYAEVDIYRYWPNLRARLEVSYKYTGQSHGTTLGKTVLVSLVETASSTTSPLVTMTFIGAGSPSSTSNRATTTRESTNTGGSGGGTSSAAGGQAGGKGVLTINPSSMRVDAGEIAVFDLCTSLSSPAFRVEDLPVGYRYVITPSGDCYKLKVFTHPLSYGRFEMTVVARSGSAEERGSLSLLVKKAETPSPTVSSPVRQPPDTVSHSGGVCWRGRRGHSVHPKPCDRNLGADHRGDRHREGGTTDRAAGWQWCCSPAGCPPGPLPDQEEVMVRAGGLP